MDHLLALATLVVAGTLSLLLSKWITGKSFHFFRWLAMTDTGGENVCTDRSKQLQSVRGASVLLTACLALLAGGYAMYIVFGEVYVAAALGLLYSLFIATIDRLIVGGTNRWLALARIPLAVIIGVTVALPLELRVAESRIEDRLERQVQASNDSLRRSLQAQVGLPRLSDRISSVRSRRQAALESARKNRRLARCELIGGDLEGCTQEPGRGPAYRRAKDRARADSLRAARLRRRVQRLSARRDSARGKLERAYSRQKGSLDAGLYTYYEALSVIRKKSSSARHLSWGIMIFFVILELTPALLKVFSTSDYDKIQAAREAATAEVESARIEEEKHQELDSIYQGAPQNGTHSSSPNGTASRTNGTQGGGQSPGNSNRPPKPNIVVP